MNWRTLGSSIIPNYTHAHVCMCMCERQGREVFSLRSPSLWPSLIGQCMVWVGRKKGSDDEVPFSGGVGVGERVKEGNPFEVVTQTWRKNRQEHLGRRLSQSKSLRPLRPYHREGDFLSLKPLRPYHPLCDESENLKQNCRTLTFTSPTL